MKKTYLLWAILALVILASSAIFAGAKFGLFVNIPAILIVVLPPLFLSFAVFPVKEIGSYWKFAGGGSATEEQLRKAQAYFGLLQRALLYSGFIGMIVGLIALLTFLGEADQVGQNAALSLLTALYSLVINVIIVVPCRAGVARKLSEV